MRLLLSLVLLTVSFNAFASSDTSYHEEKQISCLAQNILFESNTESKKGQYAVGMVTMNRVKSGKFPDSVCGVVKQKVKGTCQFSWVCDPVKRLKDIKHTDSYQQSLHLAKHIYLEHDQMPDITKGAMYFHTVYVQPNWVNLKKTTRIGQHIFYKPKDRKYES